MASRNLKTLSLAKLIALRDEIQSALAERIKVERDELQGRIDALTAMETLRGADRSSEAKTGRRTRKKATAPTRKKKAGAKYRGPDGQTWTGRGRPPRWLVDIEAGGEKRDAYLIG